MKLTTRWRIEVADRGVWAGRAWGDRGGKPSSWPPLLPRPESRTPGLPIGGGHQDHGSWIIFSFLHSVSTEASQHLVPSRRPFTDTHSSTKHQMQRSRPASSGRGRCHCHCEEILYACPEGSRIGEGLNKAPQACSCEHCPRGQGEGPKAHRIFHAAALTFNVSGNSPICPLT